MIDALLTRIVHFSARHERAITIASGIWFAISCAAWIPQIPIPAIPYLTDNNSWMVSGAWNAVWWGFAHPVLEKKRKELQVAQLKPKPKPDNPQISNE